MTKRSYDDYSKDLPPDLLPYLSQPNQKPKHSNWLCIYCDSQNNSSNNECKKCSAWQCSTCQIINPPCENSCSNCSLILNHSSQNNPLCSWACNICTFLNKPTTNACEICSNPKPKTETIPEWSCSSCTFLNPTSTTTCKICHNKKEITNQTTIFKPTHTDTNSNIIQLAKTQLLRFGHSSFRNAQLPVIKDLIKGKNVMLIAPTGSGKSLCFQIPILVLNVLCNKQQKYEPIQKGIGIVISPLISLMNDQIFKLKQIGIEAEYINSSLTTTQRNQIQQKLKQNKIEILYAAPELFTSNIKNNNIIKILQKYRIVTLFVIDEAHCISEWGHSFRPAYTKLHRIRESLDDPTTIACTATATPTVQQDIIKQLHLNNNTCKIHLSSFNRPNIFIKAIKLKKRISINKTIMQEITNYQKIKYNNPIIIYCGTQKETNETCNYLQKHMTKSTIGAYHAGLKNEHRKDIQNKFINNEINIICATNAFGMGIDKKNIGLIIHKVKYIFIL